LQDKADWVEQFLDGMTILPLDSEVAKVYGRTRAELESQGRPIGALDLMIAAHALSLRATLVTNDVRDFERVSRLRVVDWTRWDAPAT
jgi:tRNA(fMet)-specific endonuclease VapC